MNAVWRGAPCTARDVWERTGGRDGWAYTTVRTLLQRLVDKGAIAVHKRGNTSVYEPRIERSLAQRSAVRSLLDRVFDGAFGGLVQHLVDEAPLKARDRRALAELLATPTDDAAGDATRDPSDPEPHLPARGPKRRAPRRGAK